MSRLSKYHLLGTLQFAILTPTDSPIPRRPPSSLLNWQSLFCLLSSSAQFTIFQSFLNQKWYLNILNLFPIHKMLNRLRLRFTWRMATHTTWHHLCSVTWETILCTSGNFHKANLWWNLIANHYSYYIHWSRLLFSGILPFLALVFFNVAIYKRIR